MKNDLSAVNHLGEGQDIVDLTVFPVKEGKGEIPWLFFCPSLDGEPFHAPQQQDDFAGLQ